MPPDLDLDANEWRTYFCIVGELWQAVRDGQPEVIVANYLEELEGLASTTDQDRLYAQCQRILSMANGASRRGAGA